jgi:hypothetical protein
MPTASKHHAHVTDAMRKCAEECHRCHDVCLETIGTCLHESGKHADPHHIRMLMDCVAICHTSGDFMLADRICTNTCATLAPKSVPAAQTIAHA